MQPPIALLVDDDHEFRAALAEVLADEGFQVMEASNGAEALALLDSSTADVILVDLLMPVMNGWAFFAAIERRPELRTVPLVFLSAVARYAPGGGSLVLKKPLDLPSVLALLDGLRAEPPSNKLRISAFPRTSPNGHPPDSGRHK